MSWSFRIGQLFGSELRVHVTFFLLLIWIGLSAYQQAGTEGAIFNVAFVAAMFLCVIAHEYGHALMARRFGIRTPDITLLPIGGLARLERMPTNPRQEILVALAGPAVNVVIWGVLIVFFGAPGEAQIIGQDYDIASFLSRLAAVNIMLAIFNMIPAFPMDGGRVLRAALSLFTSRPRATRIATSVGQVLAVGAGFWAVSTGNVILAIIAAFVFFAAQAENADVAGRDMARGLRARDAMITQFASLSPSDNMNMAAQSLIRTTQHEFPVLASDGTLAGFLPRNTLFMAMAEGHGADLVGDRMERNIPLAMLDAPLQPVMEALGTSTAVAVVAKDRKVIGYITRENLGELMMIRSNRSR